MVQPTGVRPWGTEGAGIVGNGWWGWEEGWGGREGEVQCGGGTLGITSTRPNKHTRTLTLQSFRTREWKEKRAFQMEFG